MRRVLPDEARQDLPGVEAAATIGSSGNGRVFDKLVWSVEDVAAVLDVSVGHVYNLTSAGRIPYSKVGRLVRFSPIKVCEWLQKGGTR